MIQNIFDHNNFMYASSQEMREVCQPLFNLLKIKFFNYYRCFKKSGEFFGLVTTPELVQHHVSKKYIFTPNLKKINKNKFYYIPQPDLDDGFNQAVRDMREFFNVYYPLYIYERHKDYFDLYVYLYSGHPSLSFEYYFSNMSHLENWKNQFQINANKLLVKASNNKIQMPENMRPNEYSYQEENISFNKFNLTRREIQCVQFLLRGLSSKDIAKELLISPRTVETHIVNIKLKTQSRNKYELIYKLKDELL